MLPKNMPIGENQQLSWERELPSVCSQRVAQDVIGDLFQEPQE